MDNFCDYCNAGNLELVKYLISVYQGESINYYISWGFFHACQHNHLDVAEWLFTNFPNRYESLGIITKLWLLRDVCTNRYFDVAHFLVKNFPNINFIPEIEKLFRDSCINNNLDFSQDLVKNFPNINFMIEIEKIFNYACMNDNLDIIKNLVKHFSDINFVPEIEKLFKYSCVSNNLDFAQNLIKEFSEIFSCNDYISNIMCLYEEIYDGGQLDVAEWLTRQFPKIFQNKI